MLYYYHVFLYLTLTIICWARLYIAFQMKRNLEKRKYEIILWLILAIMFSFGLIDLIYGGYIIKALIGMGVDINYVKVIR